MFRLFLIKPLLGASLKTVRQTIFHTQNITSSEGLRTQSYNFYCKIFVFLNDGWNLRYLVLLALAVSQNSVTIGVQI